MREFPETDEELREIFSMRAVSALLDLRYTGYGKPRDERPLAVLLVDCMAYSRLMTRTPNGRNFGKKTLEEIEAMMDLCGLVLGRRPQDPKRRVKGAGDPRRIVKMIRDERDKIQAILNQRTSEPALYSLGARDALDSMANEIEAFLRGREEPSG